MNNYPLIKQFLTFDTNGDDFYFLQIIQRRKDSPLSKAQHVVKDYYIKSIEYLETHMDEIEQICKMFNARAYIGLNPVSLKKCSLYAMKEIANINITQQYGHIITMMPSLAGKYAGSGSRKYNLWVADYDNRNKANIEPIRGQIQSLRGFDGEGNDKIKAVIPTKNGYHLICTPFDAGKFERICQEHSFDFEIGIHKQGMTLLYYND